MMHKSSADFSTSNRMLNPLCEEVSADNAYMLCTPTQSTSSLGLISLRTLKLSLNHASVVLLKKDYSHALNVVICMFALPILRDDKIQASSSLALFQSTVQCCA